MGQCQNQPERVAGNSESLFDRGIYYLSKQRNHVFTDIQQSSEHSQMK